MSSSRAFKSAAAFQMLLLSRQSICRGFSTPIFLNHNAKYMTFGTSDMRIRPFASSLLSKYSQTVLYSSKEDEEKESNNDFEPTWTYTPYKPPPKKPMGGQQRRYYKKNDDWVVPNKITIPEDKLEISFARSSGAGGQNVNKVNTQVILKLNVMGANWIPHEVRQRIKENEANKINKEGQLIITSQEYRTQSQNRKDAFDKLQELILKNYPRPKVRKMRKGISKKAKAINKENKRKRSDVKKSRGRVDF